MKLKLLFFRTGLWLFLLMLVWAVPSRAQVKNTEQITFAHQQVTLQAIVDKLKSTYGYKVSYDADVNLSKQVTLPNVTISLDNLIRVLHQQAGVGLKAIDGNLILRKLELVSVSGTVISSDDKLPLTGVTIRDEFKRSLGVTNVNGKFSVMATRGSKVEFAMVGFNPQTAAYDRNIAGITISLDAANNALNEVVVTALGIKREEKALGYAATVVKGEELTKAMPNNWTEALEGKVAGLNLIRSNSGPDGSNKIILRGENNLTGNNEALIVLDGVIISGSSARRVANSGETVYGTGSDNMPADYGSNLNDLNPEDIESVTVLKGAAAAALYGELGANGAIIIVRV